MNLTTVMDLGRESLILILVLSGPLLVIGLIVGLVVGIFQAVTQIHEATLAFIPKILAVFGLFMFLLPWMTIRMVDYTVRLFSMLPRILD